MAGLRTEHSKQFVKLLDSLCGRHNRWQIWTDMVVMFATAISNAVDKRHFDKREQLYMDTAKRYTPEELNVFPQLYARMVQAVELGFQDFFGDIFMELGLGNDAGGQFFTPYSICQMMAKMQLAEVKEEIEREGYISLNDPACGAGATLIACADVMRNEMHVNYQQTAIFTGQDIDYTTGLMCYIQLSLFGCAGYVHIGNTLTNPMTGHVLFGDGGENTWYTPMFFTDVWELRRQRVLIRRAFGMPEDGPEREEPQTAKEPPVRPVEPISSEADKIPAKPEKTPHSQPRKATARKETERPADEPTLIVSTKKKNAGQLMFDLG